MDIQLPGHSLGSLLLRVCRPRPHSPVEVCLPDLVDTHNHLVYHAGISVCMLGKHRRVNLAVCRFPVPVVTQQIFLVKNIVIVRGQRNRANRENRLCKTVRVTLQCPPGCLLLFFSPFFFTSCTNSSGIWQSAPCSIHLLLLQKVRYPLHSYRPPL